MPILDWLNKNQVFNIAKNSPYRLLEIDKKLSYCDPDSQNMMIKGDNLDALKALLPYYSGQVKCIYIDPPYNTKNAFEHYDDNLEHSQWLSLMYPRLELLRDLLCEKGGSIWISIDDDESHYLKVICDEVFGRKNFVANVIWEKKFSPQNDAKWLSDSHDHILVYAKNKEFWRPNLLPRTEDMDKRYKNLDNDPRGLWTSGDLSVKTYTASTDYPITTPSGRIVNPPAGYCWRISKGKLSELIADNRIWFGKGKNNVPRLKRFLLEVKKGSVSKTIWQHSEVGNNQEAKKEVKCFNSLEVFATPKPERLLQRIFTIATNKNDIILDSFLGSGTAAAVAMKMQRKFIGIEMGDHAETHCVPRLKSVVDGEQGGISESVNWKGGAGFTFYNLGCPIFDQDGLINKEVKFDALSSHVWFSETKTSLRLKNRSPFLGVHNETGYYLLFNGILGDKSISGGNVLTSSILKKLPFFKGNKVIYGEMTRMGKEKLKSLGIIFKQIPYDIKAR